MLVIVNLKVILETIYSQQHNTTHLFSYQAVGRINDKRLESVSRTTVVHSEKRHKTTEERQSETQSLLWRRDSRFVTSPRVIEKLSR